MTERFTLELYEGTKQIKAIKDNGEIIYPPNIVNLLNELHEENDVLKQELKTKVVVNRQYEELQKLKKENEELKHQIETYKTANTLLKQTLEAHQCQNIN